MPTSSDGNRFVSSIPIPGEWERMGPLLVDVASYLDNELAGTGLVYAPPTGNPDQPLADGRELGIDFGWLSGTIRTQLISTGAVDQPEFSWLAGDHLSWNATTQALDVNPLTLAEALADGGHVAKRKYSQYNVRPFAFELSTGAFSQGGGYPGLPFMRVESLHIATKRGAGYTTGGLKVSLTPSATPLSPLWFELGGSDTFVSIQLESPVICLVPPAVYYADPTAQAGQKVVGCVTLIGR